MPRRRLLRCLRLRKRLARGCGRELRSSFAPVCYCPQRAWKVCAFLWVRRLWQSVRGCAPRTKKYSNENENRKQKKNRENGCVTHRDFLDIIKGQQNFAILYFLLCKTHGFLLKVQCATLLKIFYKKYQLDKLEFVQQFFVAMLLTE